MMWVKTENGAMVNLNRVTVIRVEELDTSFLEYEETPWGIVWHTDGMRGIIARYATKEKADKGMAELYSTAKRV